MNHSRLREQKKLLQLFSMKGYLLIAVSALAFVTTVSGHGRLLDPPGRSSIWRFPEFAHYSPPENFNDNELYCGGFGHQYEKNGGKCGICGDPYDEPRPRQNENGGTYGRGIIVRNYTKGQLIPIDVELTAAHKGYFEFRICPWNTPDKPETEACFDDYLLRLADGSKKLQVPTYDKGHYKTKLQLPPSLTCTQCVLQWNYVTGNRWGKCDNGSTILGCGPQEIFRGCADVAIR